MAEYVTLIGAEAVGRAGHNISAAAREMTRAADNIAGALAQHQQFLNEWLGRLEAALEDDRQARILQR